MWSYDMRLLLAIISVLLIQPAAAQTVTDGSDRDVPAIDLSAALSILSSQIGGPYQLMGLRRAKVTSAIYCARVRYGRHANFVPMYVNATAGIAYILGPELSKEGHEDVRLRLFGFGCL
jgi:hypothetical protein